VVSEYSGDWVESAPASALGRSPLFFCHEAFGFTTFWSTTVSNKKNSSGPAPTSSKQHYLPFAAARFLDSSWSREFGKF
jgi:hypothetical protein